MIPRHLAAALFALLLALPLSAQTARDSAFAISARRDLDSIARDRGAPQYSKRAQARIRARLDSLLRPLPTPPPPDTVVPPPVDTTPPPPPPGDTARFAGAAELPRATVDTRMPTITRSVKIGADLQAALNAAQPGDELVLPMGSTYTGNFTLPAKSGSGWIVLRADTVPVPLGARARPSLYGRAPKIRTPNQQAALTVSSNASRWRVVGLDVSHVPLTAEQYGLVEVYGDDIVLDRLWIHGAADTSNARRGVWLVGRRNAVIGSWLAEFHARGADSQGIAGGDGDGPYLIHNNRIEGAGENLIFGGADPSVQGRVPSDVTITGNHVIKPAGLRGGPWQTKYSLELKLGQRVLIEGNVFDGTWATSSGDGYGFIWASHNQGGGTWGNWSVVRDVTFRWNRVANFDAGAILSRDYDGSATPGRNFTLTDNDWGSLVGEFTGKLLVLNSSLDGVTVQRNTATTYRTVLNLTGQSFPGFSFVGNRASAQLYALNSPFGDGAAMLRAAGVPLSAFTGNCIGRPADQYILSPTYLPGNQFVEQLASCTQGGVDQAELQRRTLGVVVSP